MEIPKSFLDRFKRIYREDYGEQLSDAQALEIASKIAKLFLILSKPPDQDPDDTYG